MRLPDDVRADIHNSFMQPTTTFSITAVNAPEFDPFLAYLNDHLSDNGANGDGYFQPLSRSASQTISRRR